MDRINNCIKNSEGEITVETVIKGWQDGSGFAYETVIDTVEFADADDYFKRAVPLEDWWCTFCQIVGLKQEGRLKNCFLRMSKLKDRKKAAWTKI